MCRSFRNCPGLFNLILISPLFNLFQSEKQTNATEKRVFGLEYPLCERKVRERAKLKHEFWQKCKLLLPIFNKTKIQQTAPTLEAFLMKSFLARDVVQKPLLSVIICILRRIFQCCATRQSFLLKELMLSPFFSSSKW